MQRSMLLPGLNTGTTTLTRNGHLDGPSRRSRYGLSALPAEEPSNARAPLHVPRASKVRAGPRAADSLVLPTHRRCPTDTTTIPLVPRCAPLSLARGGATE